MSVPHARARRSAILTTVAGDTERVDELLSRLRAAGQRSTTARRAVLAEIVGAGSVHLTAEDLARRIEAEHPDIHLSTIYRTLDALTEAGIISVARFRDEPVTYHLTDDVHHHAVCTTCGTTLDLPPGILDPVRRKLADDYGFHAEPHHLTIVGTCDSCSHP
jgi:Fur family transcriptional regulator, ferric uptake regulator